MFVLSSVALRVGILEALLDLVLRLGAAAAQPFFEPLQNKNTPKRATTDKKLEMDRGGVGVDAQSKTISTGASRMGFGNWSTIC